MGRRLRRTCGTAAIALLVCSLGEGLEAQKPTRFSPVSLEAVIEPVALGNACGICGDGSGAYLDGIDGVAAEFDQYGNLIVDFLTNRTVFRKLSYDFTQPYADGAVARGVVMPDDNYMSTLHAPQTPMQDMAVGSEQCSAAVVTYTLADAKRTQFRVYFQRALAGFDMSMTSHLVVKRVDDDTWIVETAVSSCASPGSIAGVGRLVETPTKGAFNYTDRGLYYIPLKMTLTRRP